MKKINNLVSDRSDVDAVFEFGYSEQKKHISSFGEPIDLLERSFFQYRCHQYKKRKPFLFFLNIISFVFGLPLILFYLIKGMFSKNVIERNESIAAFPYKGKYDGIIPGNIYKEYNVKETAFGQNNFLIFKDLKFIWSIFYRYPMNFYFLVKIVYKIAMYRSIISEFSPAAIIVCSEYAFSSSFMTLYCRSHKIKHINVMHGEKLFSLIDTFFEFDKCYVWDEHYINLFIDMGAERSQFVIHIPEALNLNLESVDEYRYFITYYLGGEKEEQMKKIRDVLHPYNSGRRKVCIRYHPRYTDFSLVQGIFYDFEIEDPVKTSLRESFLNTQNVVSFYSTVLYQGFLNNKNIVIDDVTNGMELYEKLRNYRYIVLCKPHYLISELN